MHVSPSQLFVSAAENLDLHHLTFFDQVESDFGVDIPDSYPSTDVDT